jgi:hypothetical protein
MTSNFNGIKIAPTGSTPIQSDQSLPGAGKTQVPTGTAVNQLHLAWPGVWDWNSQSNGPDKALRITIAEHALPELPGAMRLGKETLSSMGALQPTMRVLLVYPRFPKTFRSFDRAVVLMGHRVLLPPLGLTTVAALLPQDWEFKLVDALSEGATSA